jgi:hypothetical protein
MRRIGASNRTVTVATTLSVAKEHSAMFNACGGSGCGFTDMAECIDCPEASGRVRMNEALLF